MHKKIRTLQQASYDLRKYLDHNENTGSFFSYVETGCFFREICMRALMVFEFCLEELAKKSVTAQCIGVPTALAFTSIAWLTAASLVVPLTGVAMAARILFRAIQGDYKFGQKASVAWHKIPKPPPIQLRRKNNDKRSISIGSRRWEASELQRIQKQLTGDRRREDSIEQF